MSASFLCSISYDGAGAPAELAAMVEQADAAGAANLWVASHLFHREPIATAALMLARSRRIGVVLMAMSPYTVHPVHAAMAAATLDEAFPGRVGLCFGSGAPRDLEAIGVAAAHPLAALRESIDIARALLAGETVTYAGERFRTAGRRLATGARPLPLWLAASGPRMLELAGERADGVLISAATSPAFVRWSLDLVARGEAKAGRSVRKAGLVFCSVAADARTARDRLRRTIAYILRGQHHAKNLELAGTALDQEALAAAFAREDWPAVEALVTDDVLHRHTASGTPDQVAAALAAYRAVGLDEIVTYGVQDRRQLADVLAVTGGAAA
ncbi:LLM class flavin-dependent oxidoreductase [Rhodoplanes sp. TEM]|uniref:LLM class flavin-dependent oxidoreductase n=1 Tax=Rhodoplanes tepidamans TaxID=200616 RepID=A0ABT5J402_RHOTP|nr:MULTISPECIES: LLM class flavin-dependent oxidoreductase [Rhodoplanes]MDC7784379.1 LLM class flavin-dependent oxidoreductase [Rhodoplanes tepidamans]MDC7988021.1 LLM class flavin-dependent oxidoreductase [Rhodoplanes sp. TEM]MDQ0354492.1 5,10-methylenetetrahydromethanopterin reductase [Rhodoplanes tepidamans]